MQIKILNFTGNINALFRSCAYVFLKEQAGEFSFVRRLSGNDYPRFHVYAHLEKNQNLVINLHLDQKKPSYRESGAHAHSGEYQGDLVATELQRIKIIAEKIEKAATPKKLEPW